MGEEVGGDQRTVVKEEEDGGGGSGGSSASTEVVRWEKFLPRMVIRVLLVESDDSTRHVISALLRKCSYKVSAVPDGLMAWETLKGRPHDIDLILTEVELPSISGYALLTLIMEHDICKNIPVIMMSSQDSISMVLKCMLKGAADFLIKPVRKNELKNLWQHVWRRQTHKVERTSENDAASNHSQSGYETSLQKTKGGSEKGCDAQDLSLQECKDALNRSDTSKEKNQERLKLVKSVAPQCKTGARLNSTEPEGIPCVEAYDSNGAIDLIGTIDGALKYADENLSLNNGTQFDFTAQLELSLRRYPNSLKNHSKASAFSLYNGKALFATTNGAVGEDSSKSPDLSSNQPSQNTSGVSSQPTTGTEVVVTTLGIGQSGHAEAAYPTTELGFMPVPGAYGNVLASVYYAQAGLSRAWSPKLVDKREQSPFPSSASVQSNPEIHYSDENHKQTKETTNTSVDQDMPQHNKTEPVEELRDSSSTAGPDTSNSLCNGMANHNTSSTYGSFSSTNERNASSAAGADMATTPGNMSNGGIIVHDGCRGMDPNRASQREAALAKFRLKRKDRCFEKKVRYQSRKKLAEQRPRVKGQFVRQLQNDTPMADANC